MARVRTCAILVLAWSSPVLAFELSTTTDLHLRWDNTLKYSAAFRAAARSSALLAATNSDDGDRNFDRGPISSRLDLVSELDATYRGLLGARVSGAAWYDALYDLRNDNDSPATANQVSVAHDRFPKATRRLHGRSVELLDAFAFATGHLGPMAASIRAGRHTLLWGESLLLATNGISYSQAPLDLIKALSVPGTQAKELFMPVAQVSGQLRPTSSVSLAAFYQLEWRRTRVPAAGSYFSSADLLDRGGERLFADSPGQAYFRGRDLNARSAGQWGVSARYHPERSNTELGLYWIWFHEKLPQIYLRPGAGADPARGQVGEYALVYPEDVRLVGASVATTLGGASLAGEVHLRFNTPLASLPQAASPGAPADNRHDPLYAVGNTLHAQVSAVKVLRPTALWDDATALAEVGWQLRTAVTRNADALDPGRDRQAVAFQLLFTPTWFQVRPDLDVSLPVSLAYSPKAKAPLSAFDAVHGGGALGIAISALYRKVWDAGLRYTLFFGSEEFQTLEDRDFASLYVQRTF
jgi:hypothetical protein